MGGAWQDLGLKFPSGVGTPRDPGSTALGAARGVENARGPPCELALFRALESDTGRCNMGTNARLPYSGDLRRGSHPGPSSGAVWGNRHVGNAGGRAAPVSPVGRSRWKCGGLSGTRLEC
jgi:hypothetical protein